MGSDSTPSLEPSLEPTNPPPTDPAPASRRRRADLTDALRRRVRDGRGSPAGRRATAIAAVVAENLRNPLRVAVGIALVSLALRLVWLTQTGRSLIFDEAYYVNAARIILGLPATGHYVGSPAGFDPNTEHPPLGKLLIAGSMLIFGDNGVGWRLPSVIAGTVELVAVFLIVRALYRSPWVATLVVGLVAFDNLTFIHGRIGTLDVLVLAPSLVGAWLALRRRWALAGVAMGIALLIKVTAIYAIGAVILYLLLTDGLAWWRARHVPLLAVLAPAGFLLVTLGVAIGGLTALDLRFSRYATPIDHLSRIVGYGAALQAPAKAGICPGTESRPWEWIFNECQITYFRVDQTVRSGDRVVSSTARVDFRGALNPLLASAIPFATLFTLWYAWRRRNRLALWALAWGAANYLPYVALSILLNRITYIYYAVPLVPALAIAVALLLLRARLPRIIRVGYLVSYALGFVAYFPFRSIP